MTANAWVWSFLTWWAFYTLLGAYIGSRKAATGFGLSMGFFFGPLGILVILFSSGDYVPCPACLEPRRSQSFVCPHCRTPRS